jgi:hypothetical protein
MTHHQEKAVNRIKDMIKTEFFTCHREAELKEFDVNENEYFVSVVFEVGGKNDEGTLASIFCRERGQVFIGPRGGITYSVFSKKLKKTVEKPMKSLYSVYYDQKYEGR